MINKSTFFIQTIILVFTFALPRYAFANASPEGTLPQVGEVVSAPKAVVVEVPADVKLQQLLDTKLTVDYFDIQGVKSVSLEELNAVFTSSLNKPLKLQNVIDLANVVTKIYADKGYPLSFAYIPAQDFSNHKVVVLVIEGYVGNVNVQGNFGGTESKIRSIVEPMLREKPLTKNTMERCNGLLSLLPGLAIQASLNLPERRDGASELLISANRITIAAGVNVESMRPKARGVITIQTNSQTASAEQFTFTALASQQDEEYYAAGYSQMLGSKGLTLKVNGSMYDGTTEEYMPANEKRKVLSLRLSSSLSYPLLINRNESLIGSVTLSAINYEDKFQNKTEPRSVTSKTNSRALAIGAIYTNIKPGQAQRLQLTLTKGLDILESAKSYKANFDTSQIFVNPDDLQFTKLNLALVQNNAYAMGFGSAMSLSAQFSADQLPLSERIQFGGYQYGRAFAPGVLAGDSGWGLGLEINKPLPLFYDFSYFKLVALQPYVLFEAARTIQNNKATDSTSIQHLSSLATGLRFQTDKAGTLDMSIAKALSDQSLNISTTGLTFNLNYGMLLN